MKPWCAAAGIAWGVVNGAGERVADDIENWAETQLAAHDDDLGQFFDTHVESGLQATRLIGKTHYLVAPLGEGAGDFLQVEVGKELQEVISHPLFREELPPASLEVSARPSRTLPRMPCALSACLFTPCAASPMWANSWHACGNARQRRSRCIASLMRGR